MIPRPTCTSCVLPVVPPDVTADARGVCDRCAAWSRVPIPVARTTELTRILQAHRGGRYDCVFHCTGGADTISALYLAVTRFRLRPLVFTPDNGFEQAVSMENVRRAVRILGLDWRYERAEPLRDLYRDLVAPGQRASVCTACFVWEMNLAAEVARSVGVGLVVSGWSVGHLAHGAGDGLELRSIIQGTSRFIQDLRRRRRAFRDMPTTLEEVGRRRGVTFLSPFWFVPEPTDVQAWIARDLQWEPPIPTYPMENTKSCCRMSLANAWLDLRRFGLTHYHAEQARLVRRGLRTRAEALEVLSMDLEAPAVRDALTVIARDLGAPMEGISG